MDPSTTLTIGTLIAAPIVDVDNTLFVQIAIFTGLMAALNVLLFKPWLAVRARRFEQIEGAFEKATELRTEADELSEHYDLKMMRARDKAMGVRSDRRKDGEAEREKVVGAARTEAGQLLESERSRLDDEEAKARQALEGRVSDLAKEITDKVLGKAS